MEKLIDEKNEFLVHNNDFFPRVCVLYVKCDPDIGIQTGYCSSSRTGDKLLLSKIWSYHPPVTYMRGGDYLPGWIPALPRGQSSPLFFTCKAAAFAMDDQQSWFIYDSACWLHCIKVLNVIFQLFWVTYLHFCHVSLLFFLFSLYNWYVLWYVLLALIMGIYRTTCEFLLVRLQGYNMVWVIRKTKAGWPR